MNPIPTNPGALSDIPDGRDFRWEDIQVGAATTPFDWDKGYDIEAELGFRPVVNDQENSTSCGGQATSKLDEILEYLATKTYEQRSAAFIYNQTVVYDANTNKPLGSRMRDNLEIVRKQGVSLESLCPSVPATDEFILRPGAITAEARESAKLAKAKSYAYVTGINIESCAQAIAANGGAIILLGGENNGTWGSEFPKPPSYRQWGHFVYAGKARKIKGKKYIGLLNSWGKKTGNQGWQWIGEDYFKSGFIESIATMVFNDAPAPPAYVFTRNLGFGSTGIDVKFLQAYLNKKGFPVASSGPGSPGQETTYFGTLTRSALAKYQAANGISPAIGYFGPLTRSHINSNP